MKPSYTSNEMTQYVAHFDVSKKKIYDDFENICPINQIDDLQSSNKSSHESSVLRTL